MDMTTEGIPRVETQESEKLARVEPASSPPPNCAICLGTCANKCFTDCCLHQFCFNCLLEWSKIKAECPLCKQPFKSIIYNIKSNSEYEEHVITNPARDIVEDDLLEIDDAISNFYLPNGPRPRRHFQFRTTLTVDQGGEFAIQQLLLSHPLTNSILFPNSLNRYSHSPLRSISFRRAIYQNNWWAAPDMTGRYRECTPEFFRENPGQTHRIQPWLNRELGALMIDIGNIYIVQQRIIELLIECHILSSTFKSTITHYLRTYTEHFIHEFFHFVRSPFDMIGYDSHVRYNFRRPDNPLPTYHSVSESEDSDVRVIDSPNDCIYVAPRTPEVIVIHSDNSDSDVIYQAPTPPPVVVVDSDTGDDNMDRTSSSNSTKLPIKLRLKLKKTSSKQKHSKRKRYNSESNSDSSDNSRYKTEVQYRISGLTSRSSDSSTTSTTSTLDSSNDSASDWSPVKSESKYTNIKVPKRKKVKKETDNRYKFRKKYDIKRFVRKSKKKNRITTSDSEASSERNYKVRKSSKKSSKSKKSNRRECEKSKKSNKRLKVDCTSDSESDCAKSENEQENNINIDDSNVGSNENIKQELPTSIPLASLQNVGFLNFKRENENPTENYDIAGPSSGIIMPSVIVTGNNLWFRRPDVDDTNSSNSE